MSDDYGPGGAAGMGSPIYDRPIPIVDAMSGTWLAPRKGIVRDIIDKALANWQLAFTVQRMAEEELAYTWTTENINAGKAMTDVIGRKILLVRLRTGSGENFGGWIPNEQGGMAAFSPWRDWWRKSGRASAVGVVGHEIGHALGFNHTNRGIMSGTLKPNDTDLRLAKEYYG